MEPSSAGHSMGMLLAVLFAVLGGLTFAVSTVLQQRAASAAPKNESLHLHLLVRLAQDRVWLAGLVTAVLAFTFQAAALAFGSLTLVQPLLVSDLVFALPLATRMRRQRMHARDWTGAGLIVGGLALFLVVASPTSKEGLPGLSAWLVVGAAVAGVCLATVLAARVLRGARRAIVLAIGAGVLFGALAALTKSFTYLLSTVGVVATLTHWEPYGLAVVALIGLLFAQSAFQAGPLAASLSVIDPLEPSVAIVIGIFAFDDSIAGGPVAVPLEVLGLLAVVAGIWVLDHSPLVLGRRERGRPADAAAEPAAESATGGRGDPPGGSPAPGPAAAHIGAATPYHD